MNEEIRPKNEITEKQIEADIIEKYPFLASRMDRLKQPVHYNESHLTHMAKCQEELGKLGNEFNNLSPKEKEVIKKALDLHEINKVVKDKEVPGVDENIGNEARSGQIIKAKFSELGIDNEAEARIISFLVSNYHILNELVSKKVKPEEVAGKLSEFCAGSNLKAAKLLELLRIVSNANNLSVVDIKNKEESTKWSKEKVKKMVDDVAAKINQLL